MMRALCIWLAASAIGAMLVAFLPEHLFGEGAVFSLSERHGPSRSDSVGLLFILGGWLYFLYALWRRRRAIGSPWAAFACVASMLLAGLACIAAFAANADAWGIALAVVALAAQFGLAILARHA